MSRVIKSRGSLYVAQIGFELLCGVRHNSAGRMLFAFANAISFLAGCIVNRKPERKPCYAVIVGWPVGMVPCFSEKMDFLWHNLACMIFLLRLNLST